VENNIYFERAFDDFVDFLAHSKLTPAQVRDVLNEIELANAKVHGYGSKTSGKIFSRRISIWRSARSARMILCT